MHIVGSKKFWKLTTFCQQFVYLFLIFELRFFVHYHRIYAAKIDKKNESSK